MNAINAPIPITAIQALVPVSRRLFIEFDSQPELAVPLTSVYRLRVQPTGPDESSAPATALPVETKPTPYSHWGINE
jgi:hypothetical protein